MSGILAGFETEHALRQAIAALGDHRFRYETYTPKPLDEKPTGSPLPLIMFIAGMIGFCGFFYLLAWESAWNWPLDIGGRPPFSWPTFVPVTFELGILSSVGAGFLGYFVINRMPSLYQPIDNCVSMGRAIRDLWIVVVESEDASRLSHAGELLARCAPLRIEEIPPQ